MKNVIFTKMTEKRYCWKTRDWRYVRRYREIPFEYYEGKDISHIVLHPELIFLVIPIYYFFLLPATLWEVLKILYFFKRIQLPIEVKEYIAFWSRLNDDLIYLYKVSKRVRNIK